MTWDIITQSIHRVYTRFVNKIEKEKRNRFYEKYFTVDKYKF